MGKKFWRILVNCPKVCWNLPKFLPAKIKFFDHSLKLIRTKFNFLTLDFFSWLLEILWQIFVKICCWWKITYLNKEINFRGRKNYCGFGLFRQTSFVFQEFQFSWISSLNQSIFEEIFILLTVQKQSGVDENCDDISEGVTNPSEHMFFLSWKIC